MSRRGIASIVLLSALLAACGEDGGEQRPTPSGDRDDDSPADLVRTLPDLPESGPFTVAFGDVAGIAAANGVDVPTDGDVDSLLDWALSSGTDGVPIVLPASLREPYLGSHDEFDDELGVSLFGTERYAGVDAAPYELVVLQGDHDADDLSEALGEPDDGVWSVGGDELELDLASGTAARPRGEALRLAVGAGVATIAATKALATGAAEATGTLVDDDLAAVLDELDAPDLVSGILVRTDLPGVGLATHGVAYRVANGEVEARLVLGYPDAEAADEAADGVEQYFTQGVSLTGADWADLLTVEEVSADGAVVVVELSFGPDQSPNVPVQVLGGNPADLPQARS